MTPYPRDASLVAPSSIGGFDPSTTTDPIDAIEALRANVERVVRGKPEVVELAITCLVGHGHLLIEDVPGVGKTLLAKALASSVDGTWRRVQFTPDLLPSDITGVTIFDRDTSELRFRPGPIFSNLVLCDEINRASPKAQSALLEAMEERQVTVDGDTYGLPQPCMVIATQNPIEHAGTHPLPESQLDRFLVRTSIGYPDRMSEMEVLERHGDDRAVFDLRPVVTTRDVVELIRAAEEIYVAPVLRGYVVDIAAASRRHPSIRLGVSPRGGLGLIRAARARALAAGRPYVVPDDVQSLVHPVLGHRLLLDRDAIAQGVSRVEVLDEIVASVPVPARRN